MHPIRRRQRRMRGYLPGPEGLARRGASAALHGLPVVTTTGGAARLASAPSPCQRGSREILRQAPEPLRHTCALERDIRRQAGDVRGVILAVDEGGQVAAAGG